MKVALKIILIVMQMVCAGLYGWLGFKHSDKVMRIMYIICAVLWVLAALFNAASLAVG